MQVESALTLINYYGLAWLLIALPRGNGVPVRLCEEPALQLKAPSQLQSYTSNELSAFGKKPKLDLAHSGHFQQPHDTSVINGIELQQDRSFLASEVIEEHTKKRTWRGERRQKNVCFRGDPHSWKLLLEEKISNENPFLALEDASSDYFAPGSDGGNKRRYLKLDDFMRMRFDKLENASEEKLRFQKFLSQHSNTDEGSLPNAYRMQDLYMEFQKFKSQMRAPTPEAPHSQGMEIIVPQNQYAKDKRSMMKMLAAMAEQDFFPLKRLDSQMARQSHSHSLKLKEFTILLRRRLGDPPQACEDFLVWLEVKHINSLGKLSEEDQFLVSELFQNYVAWLTEHKSETTYEILAQYTPQQLAQKLTKAYTSLYLDEVLELMKIPPLEQKYFANSLLSKGKTNEEYMPGVPWHKDDVEKRYAVWKNSVKPPPFYAEELFHYAQDIWKSCKTQLQELRSRALNKGKSVNAIFRTWWRGILNKFQSFKGKN
ncbi:hypothetical protein O181_047214 [Austropuccinia psidii MF-1]|uniref:Uncharacterized protein n=1 Tax=Austropuccinia psidii MF-1 TaxID=1389203 RepID=A0A9Q3DQE3_9BASI|nr:hypothetical protein [Austropuccinia psidii MF-1]